MAVSRRNALLLLAATYGAALGVAILGLAFSDEIAGACFGGRSAPLVYYRARLEGILRVGLVAATAGAVIAAGLLSGRDWLRVLASNLAVVAALAIGAEIALRAVDYEAPAIPRPGTNDRGLWVYHASRGWYHEPGATGRSDLGGPDAGDIRINSLGLRESEVSVAKPPGVKRLLVLGDSYAFGVGVDAEHVFSARLAERIASVSEQPWQVLNLGVSGYSTDQEYLLFRDLGRSLAPDLVVLIVCDNDYGANARNFEYSQYYKPTFTLGDDGEVMIRDGEVPRLSRWQRAKVWLAQESRLWNALRARDSDVPALQRALDFFDPAVPDVSTDERVPLLAGIVRRLAHDAAGVGAPLVVTTTAGSGAADAAPSLRAEDAALASALDAAGIAYVDLWPVLGAARAADPDGHWDFPGNRHWNVDAHRSAADAVFEHLRASGFWRSGAIVGATGGSTPSRRTH